MSQRFAVIGNPIAHSLSPIIHQCFAKQVNVQLTYEKIQGDDASFEEQVSDFFAQDGKGMNVTLPFKQRAFAMAKNCSERCLKAGAANTLWMEENQLHADNTDGIGLVRDLTRYIGLAGKRLLILGAGGAARGIIYPLLENTPQEIVVTNRTVSKAEEFQRAFPQIKSLPLNEIDEQFDVVLNATSAGLAGEFIALPEACLAGKPFCYDLSYKQNGITPFVQYAKESNCDAVDGLGMLVEQAAEAFFIWHGMMPETQEVLTFLRQSM